MKWFDCFLRVIVHVNFLIPNILIIISDFLIQKLRHRSQAKK